MKHLSTLEQLWRGKDWHPFRAGLYLQIADFEFQPPAPLSKMLFSTRLENQFLGVRIIQKYHNKAGKREWENDKLGLWSYMYVYRM